MRAHLSKLVLLSVLFALPHFAQAKELTNRLGIGYSDQFSEELPSVTMRYWPDPKLGVGAALGIDTQKDESKFGFMARLYRIIFTEDNMNFYMGTGAGLISVETKNTVTNKSSNDSGFELNGFFGCEFFLPGLDSLGITFEGGVGVTSISSEVRFRTMGDSPIRAGMTFYF
jgi:hypothetical protein